MLVVNLARRVVCEMVVLGRRARFPVVPRALGVDRVHAAELFDSFAMRVLGGVCHMVILRHLGP